MIKTNDPTKYSVYKTNSGIEDLSDPIFKKDSRAYPVLTKDDDYSSVYFDSSGNIHDLPYMDIDIYPEDVTPKYHDLVVNDYKNRIIRLRRNGYNYWADQAEAMCKREGPHNALAWCQQVDQRRKELEDAEHFKNTVSSSGKKLVQRYFDSDNWNFSKAVDEFVGGINFQKRKLQGNMMYNIESAANSGRFTYYDKPTDEEYKTNTYKQNVPQITYLMSRSDQHDAFLNSGFSVGTPGDYGLVRKAVGNRNIPIYQKNPDAVSGDSLQYINYFLTSKDEDFEQPLVNNPNKIATLENAFHYPIGLYVHKNTGDIYFKAWDLNDYGQDDNGARGTNYGNDIKIHFANLLDKVGNPTVVTTGFQPVIADEEKHINRTISNLYDTDRKKYNEVVPYFKPNESNYLAMYYRFLLSDKFKYIFKNQSEYNQFVAPLKNQPALEKRVNEYQKRYPYDTFKKNIRQFYSPKELIDNGIYISDDPSL